MTSIRPTKIHVILMDGTFASLDDERRSSIGRIHALLRSKQKEVGKKLLNIHYAPGQEWNSWRTLPDLMMGNGLTTKIINAYGWLARHYHPGDQIYLLGYSRGAFAIRSLAGMIGRIGLLRPEFATRRNIALAWRYYSKGGSDKSIGIFRRRRGQPDVPIQMIGCFDTVMALGIRLPLLWMLTEPRFRFHDTHLGKDVAHGFQALALDETRVAFAPVLWNDSSMAEHIKQMWFRGAHADIGGQLSGLEVARPLANIPLVWMLESAESVGLPLPDGWHDKFHCDVNTPSVGNWRNWGKAFLARHPRLAGQNATEALHNSVPLPYDQIAHLTGHLENYLQPEAENIPGSLAEPISDKYRQRHVG